MMTTRQILGEPEAIRSQDAAESTRWRTAGGEDDGGGATSGHEDLRTRAAEVEVPARMAKYESAGRLMSIVRLQRPVHACSTGAPQCYGFLLYFFLPCRVLFHLPQIVTSSSLCDASGWVGGRMLAIVLGRVFL